jgi:hypothetical protein
LAGREGDTIGGGEEDDANDADNEGSGEQGIPPVFREIQQQETHEEASIGE